MQLEINYLSVESNDDCPSLHQRHFRTSRAMNSRLSIPSLSSTIGKFETDKVDASLFSNDSLLVAGLNWELKDLLNKDDNDGSDCLAEGTPANAAGWKDRFGRC